MTETVFSDNLTLIMAKHKTAIKIATSIVTDYADRESNTCILISIFCFRIFVPGKLKGMRTRCQAKILSCFFNVWCKSRGLQGMVRPGCPCVTPVVESFSSDLLRAKISYWEESPCCSGITTAQLHSTKLELRFCAGSNPAACRRFAMVRISDNGPGWK